MSDETEADSTVDLGKIVRKLAELAEELRELAETPIFPIAANGNSEGSDATE